MVADQPVPCPDCALVQHLTILGRFRKHGPKDNPCLQSGELAPGRELPCPKPRTTSPTSNDAQETAQPATDTTEWASDTFPEISTESTTTRPPRRRVTTVATSIDDYEQPDKLRRPVRGMTDDDRLGVELAATLREMFAQYVNRVGRSAQTHLGPSEIGSPCDRRLVMRMLGLPPVNPGSDKWAAFVGTCVHAGLAEMFDWADAGRGRFATEMKVFLPNSTVPKGTLDVLDRTLFMVDDHKVMGKYSLDKLRSSGPSQVYRVQLHVYAMGARMRGEKVERVAIIAWPRQGNSLDDLHVWTEPYDPEIARNALDRITRLRTLVEQAEAAGADPVEVAAATEFDDDCRYCEYHQEDAKDLTHGGCNGRA